MVWDDIKATSDNLTAAEYNAMVVDQKSRMASMVEDTTPQMGGNLDPNGNDVGDASEADLTKLSELTATSTELNYVDNVTSAIQTQLDDIISSRGALTVGTAGSGATYITDGTLDNVQIQAAIDAAYAAGGGVVHLLAGTYTIGAVMNMETGVILMGDGIGNTLIQMVAGANCNFFDTEEEDRWTVKDIQFDGNGTNQTSGGWGFMTRGCEYVSIIDVEILNPRNGGGLFSCVDPSGTPGAPSLYCKATRVRTYNKTGSSTTDLFATQKSSNCGFIDCIAEKTVLSTDNGFGLYGITGGSAITSSQGNYAIGCIAIDCQKGFNLEWTNSSLISGCVSRDCDLTGFNVSDAHDCVITGCTSYNDPHGLSIDADATGIMVSNCSFYNSTTYGMLNKGDYVTFSNCMVRDTNDTDGVLMEDADFCAVLGCTVVDAGKDSTWKSGIQATRCESIRIQGNQVRSTTGSTTYKGIHITGAMNYCLCSGNIIEDMNQSGIEASDFTYGLIANNTLANNGAYGIDWNTGTNTGSAVRDNMFHNNSAGDTNP